MPIELDEAEENFIKFRDERLGKLKDVLAFADTEEGIENIVDEDLDILIADIEKLADDSVAKLKKERERKARLEKMLNDR